MVFYFLIKCLCSSSELLIDDNEDQDCVSLDPNLTNIIVVQLKTNATKRKQLFHSCKLCEYRSKKMVCIRVITGVQVNNLLTLSLVMNPVKVLEIIVPREPKSLHSPATMLESSGAILTMIGL